MADRGKDRKPPISFWVRSVILAVIVLAVLIQLAFYLASFNTPAEAFAGAPMDRYELSGATELLDQLDTGGRVVQLWRDAASGSDASYAVFAWKKGWNGNYRCLYEMLVPQEWEGRISFGFRDSFFWNSYLVTSDDRIAEVSRTFEPGSQAFFWIGILASWVLDAIIDGMGIILKEKKKEDNSPPRNPF